jgi:hypothetical protein
MSKRIVSVGLLSGAVLLSGAIGLGSGAAAPQAQSAVDLTACDIDGKQKSLGASYVTSLKVAGVSCAKGENLVRRYHACRKDKGGAVCGSPGLGFRCKEGKRQKVPGVQYSSTMKCRKGEKRVKSSYTQNI